MKIFKTTWRNIRRSPYQAFAAVFVMTLTFLFISFFTFLLYGSSKAISYFESRPQVTAFFKNEAKLSDITSLQNSLKANDKVASVKFVSQQDALKIYKEQNKNNPMLTEMVTSSILPASFEVSVSDPKVLEQISQDFTAKTSQVDEIIYQKDIIKSLLNWTNFIRKTGITIVSVTTAITFLIIFVIIGMKITSRKDEINVSRLLGASNFYVKRPFLIEGIIYGLSGSLLGLLITYSLLAYFYRQINLFFNPVVFVSTNLSLYAILLVSSLVLGSLIGFCASWIGVKRYIKF